MQNFLFAVGLFVEFDYTVNYAGMRVIHYVLVEL